MMKEVKIKCAVRGFANGGICPRVFVGLEYCGAGKSF